MPNKLCLNAIVKNEEHVIVRMMKNVAHLIDAYAIVDTGSTDNTIQLITDFMKSRNIPGSVVSRPWKDFGYNRTEAIRHGEKVTSELSPSSVPKGPLTKEEWETIGTSPDSVTWYLLFMDADNLLRTDADPSGEKQGYSFNVQQLMLDAYMIDMVQASVRYSYTWLIRLDPLGRRKWKWYGPLHEYVAPEGWSMKGGKLLGGFIISGREGARNKDPLKYLKDAVVLEGAILEEPKNERYHFYLAQSYRDAGRPDDAIRCYLKRATMGGWQEEVYMSRVEAGRLLLSKSERKHEGIQNLLMAMNDRANRLEAVYYLVHLCREAKIFNIGYLLGSFALSQPATTDVLFVDQNIHKWMLLDEVAVCAYYSGKKEECSKLSKRALDSGAVPKEHIERIKKNLSFC